MREVVGTSNARGSALTNCLWLPAGGVRRVACTGAGGQMYVGAGGQVGPVDLAPLLFGCLYGSSAVFPFWEVGSGGLGRGGEGARARSSVAAAVAAAAAEEAAAARAGVGCVLHVLKWEKRRSPCGRAGLLLLLAAACCCCYCCCTRARGYTVAGMFFRAAYAWRVTIISPGKVPAAAGRGST
ncbi:hypothetical protein PLESTB_000976500 [Pleodorina starrii]|uniref:Uncharacterized protein n=1 Tax=Pleodorina starrii TaxID=330485 RepID=A0A9W6BP14_9CHLO|nr:hypothetical protein PLESTB_000976500 [Pleodorina starrii]GLC66227.1 hypothetical protein PLESTF_000401300 [Pleodorina starrii]